MTENDYKISLDDSSKTHKGKSYSKHLARISRLRKQINSKLVNLKLWTRATHSNSTIF